MPSVPSLPSLLTSVKPPWGSTALPHWGLLGGARVSQPQDTGKLRHGAPACPNQGHPVPKSGFPRFTDHSTALPASPISHQQTPYPNWDWNDPCHDPELSHLHQIIQREMQIIKKLPKDPIMSLIFTPGLLQLL